jgi:hypothetical protein
LANRVAHLPATATSIAAMSIFFIFIIASKTRLAATGSGPATASVSARGEICHDSPHLSLHATAPPVIVREHLGAGQWSLNGGLVRSAHGVVSIPRVAPLRTKRS